MALKWLSEGVKASFLPEYGRYTQTWSRARLSELAARIEDLVDLSVGTSIAFDRPPMHVIEAVKKAIEADAIDVDAVTQSADELKEVIASNYQTRYGINTDPRSEVCLTVGAAQAIDCTLRILVNPGDEILVIDPDYSAYEPHARSYQAKVVPVPLTENDPGCWCFNPDELTKRITKRTKLLMMSNPNNPTGILYSKEQNEMIAELAIKNDFFVLADHVSEEIVFDSSTFHNIACTPGMKERTIICSSFSKAHCLDGFRMGYALASNDIVRHMNSIKGWTTDGIVAPGVVAALAALKGPQDWIREHVQELQERRDMMVEHLNRMDGVACQPPKGVYWAFPNIKGFGMSSHDLSEYLLVEGKVYVRPGFWYGRKGEGHLRISFCVNPKWIDKGMDRMEEALKKLKRP